MSKWDDISAAVDYKLSEESARAELKKLCLYYEVDLSETIDGNEAAVDAVFSRLVKGFRSSRLEILEDDKGLTVVQTLRNKETLSFGAFKGDLKPKLDAIAGDAPYKRMHTLAGMLCGLGFDAIGKLSPPDLRLTEAVASFFLMCC